MDWQARGKQEVAMDDGAVVIVRRVDQYEMVAAMGELASLVGGEAGAVASPAQQVAYGRFFLEHGTVTPRVWGGPFDETPAGHVHVSAFLPLERERIIAAILKVSGFPGQEDAGVRTFPEVPGGGDAGSGGGEVRGDAESVPAESAG